jgi:hypothetical protein
MLKNRSPIYNHFGIFILPLINFLVQSTHPRIELQIQPLNSKFYKLMILWLKNSTKINQIDDKITKLD